MDIKHHYATYNESTTSSVVTSAAGSTTSVSTLTSSVAVAGLQLVKPHAANTTKAMNAKIKPNCFIKNPFLKWLVTLTGVEPIPCDSKSHILNHYTTG